MKGNKNGYKPKIIKKIPRKPSKAETHRICKIKMFADSLDFKKYNINWGKGKRGPKPSNPSSLLAVWLYGYMNGNNKGRFLEKELKRNKDLQYLSEGALFSDSILNKFRLSLGSCLNEILKDFIKYEKDPHGSLSLDGTQIECAGSHYQFRKVENLEMLKKKAYRAR